MTKNGKAVFPGLPAFKGRTASKTTARQNTKSPSIRQRVKRLLIWLACRGFIPVGVAEWLLRRGGLRHA